MSRTIFLLRTAVNNLRRGGQRVLVAMLCVAFGVMSLAAMTMVSTALETMLVDTPQDLIGADISMDRDSVGFFTPAEVQGLEDLRKEGLLSKYTLVAYSSSLAFRYPDSGELHFTVAGIGIDPAAYPPTGSLTVESPGNVGLATLLQEPGDVIVSRDLALLYHLKVGDALILSDLSMGAGIPVRIRGIVVDTPNHQGSKFYYSQATAARLLNDPQPFNTVLANSPDPEAAEKRLRELGWRAWLATFIANGQKAQQEFFAGLLNGAGVLGLLVSGIGVADTMQVLLRRRRREIAIWKSLGYTQGTLLWLFAFEAGLLGLLGSLLGAGLGVALSLWLVNLFTRTSTLLVNWQFSATPVLLALGVGVATTVIFALWAIVTTSRVRPVTLLRDAGAEAGNSERLPWFQALALLLALVVPFTAVTSTVMGALWKGIAVLVVALAGLVGMGGMLFVLLWLVLRLLPLRGAPLLDMARGNLRRRGLSPIFAMIALFVGVISLTAGCVVAQNAQRVMLDSTIKIEGDNLTILAPVGKDQPVAEAIREAGVDQVTMGYYATARAIRMVGQVQGADPQALGPELISRDEPGEFRLVSGAPWGSRPDGVYTPAGAHIPPGSQLAVTLADGSTRTLPVVGAYQLDYNRAIHIEQGLLLPTALGQSLTPPERVQYFLHVPVQRLSSAADQLGKALPDVTVIDRVAYAARFTNQYHNIFLLAISISSLALLAGVMLVANSVSLAMLDRRYEIGVLKAMGYARRHVLVTLVVEYGIMAGVATGAGLGLIRGFLWLASLANGLVGSLLRFTGLAAGAVALAALGLTLLTVLAVTWRPTQVSPLVVLNDRE